MMHLSRTERQAICRRTPAGLRPDAPRAAARPDPVGRRAPAPGDRPGPRHPAQPHAPRRAVHRRRPDRHLRHPGVHPEPEEPRHRRPADRPQRPRHPEHRRPGLHHQRGQGLPPRHQPGTHQRPGGQARVPGLDVPRRRVRRATACRDFELAMPDPDPPIVVVALNSSFDRTTRGAGPCSRGPRAGATGLRPTRRQGRQRRPHPGHAGHALHPDGFRGRGRPRAVRAEFRRHRPSASRCSRAAAPPARTSP